MTDSNTSTNNTLHEVKNTAPSSYVVQYHMTREPFSDTIENDLFYAEPGRQQKLDILLHLTQYGNELVIVTGPTGSGKSTLLQQYLSKALDSWYVAHIDAQSGIDERKLLQQLFHQMNMDFHGATHSELFERMQHHFDALQHSARQAVLLIDNAEHLPVTALKRVLEMAALTSTDNKPLLRVILFGSIKLIENLDDPLLEKYDSIVRRSVELLPFEQEHTAHYILHRLSAANFSADKPFTDSALHKIHKQSNGWPGRINKLAHNLLIETLPTPGLNLGSSPRMNRLRLGATLVVLLLIGSLLLFQDEFNTWLKPEATRNVTLPAPIPPLEDEQTGIPASATMALSPEQTVDTSSAEPFQPDVAAEVYADAEVSPTETVPSVTEEKTAPAEQPATALTETNTTSVPLPALVAEEPAQPPAVGTKPTLIPDDLPGFRAEWIRAQNPEHYTLQLVAGNNLKTLRSFISQHTLAEPLAIYRTTRKGKPWFGLIQQSYPSKQAAITARKQLPAPLRKQQPWVRKFTDLQKDLQQTP